MPEPIAPYFLNAGEDGTFKDSGKFKSSPADVDGLITYLDKADIDKLVVYFHGGLVSEKSGMEAAVYMRDNLTDLTVKRHVVSFIWETGVKEVFLQNLKYLEAEAKKSFYDEALKFVIKIAARKLGLSDGAKGQGEYLDDNTIESEKMKDAPFEDLVKVADAKGGAAEMLSKDDDVALSALSADARYLIDTQGTDAIKKPDEDEKENLSDDLFEGKEEGSKGFFSWAKLAIALGKIALNVIKRYHKQTHHDFYPTVVEETFRLIYLGKIGTWGWSMIKQKADKMFGDNSDRAGDNLYVGSYFLSKLEAHRSNRLSAKKKFEIELIGHSAGSIAICYLLRSVMERHKNLKFNTVFFLAPACRVDLFINHAVKAKLQGFFQAFRMYTMLEDYEKKDHCIKYVYTHSLLYLVSGLFELDANNEQDIDSKIMGLNEQFRAEGRYSAIDILTTLKTFLGDCKIGLSQDNMHNDPTMHTWAQAHGDFDNDPVTIQSIKLSLT